MSSLRLESDSEDDSVSITTGNNEEKSASSQKSPLKSANMVLDSDSEDVASLVISIQVIPENACCLRFGLSCA